MWVVGSVSTIAWKEIPSKERWNFWYPFSVKFQVSPFKLNGAYQLLVYILSKGDTMVVQWISKFRCEHFIPQNAIGWSSFLIRWTWKFRPRWGQDQSSASQSLQMKPEIWILWKIHGPPNNHFLVDVWWISHLPGKDLESSNWNNHSNMVV